MMKFTVRSHMRVSQKSLSTSASLTFGVLKLLTNRSNFSSLVTATPFSYERISGLHSSASAMKTDPGGYGSIRSALTKTI